MAGGDISSKEPKINKDDPPPYYKPELKTPYFILYEADTKVCEVLYLPNGFSCLKGYFLVRNCIKCRHYGFSIAYQDMIF